MPRNIRETGGGIPPMINPLKNLNKSFNYIVTPYHWPDTDGIACAVAVSEYILRTQGIKAIAMISQTPQIETQWVMNKLGVTLPQIIDVPKKTRVIVVDTSDPDDLPPVITRRSVTAIIDHRKYHRAEEFPKAKVQIEEVGAAATLVAEKFYQKALIPELNTAILLYAGIASNTINFKASSTTDRDRQIAQWLKGLVDHTYNLGESYLDQFTQEMFEAKSNFKGQPMKKPIEDDLSSRLQEIAGVPTAVAQFEIIGVRELFRQRGAEIIEALEQIRQERGAGRIFMSAIDLNEGRNIFLFLNEADLELLAKVINLQYDGEFYVSDSVITRKELITALQTS